MEDNEKFEYSYKSSQREEILEIRRKYVDAESMKINRVRQIDAMVNRKANAAGLLLGIPGCLIMGGGLSLCLTAENYIAGVPIGLIGIAAMIMAHPVYKRVLLRERQKHAEEIMKLTDEILGKKAEE